MKKYIYQILCAVLLGATSCSGFSDAANSEEVKPLQIDVNLKVDVDRLDKVKELTFKLDNYADGYHYTKKLNDVKGVFDDVVPGIYTVSVSGMAYDTDGTEYYVNGNAVNKALFDGTTTVDITLKGLKVSPLVFKEIYYAGSKTPSGTNYFRDQFYEIYNNSDQIQYLDGLYFAQLYPTNATRKLPVWEGGTDDNVCYGERVWRFPGHGTDYPLRPGESIVIAQFATNHRQAIYNPDSPVDCSSAEFEFFPFNNRLPDMPATNMDHVFYDGKAQFGTMPQFLTAVFGSAFALFQVPEGDNWDPVKDKNYQAKEVGKKNIKCKIPINYILDAVECINNETYADAKRIPAAVDAGMTWVGNTYCGLSVSRKVMRTESGEMQRRDNGALLFQDTNNSTDDFERGLKPELHRYETGVPQWHKNK
ncbi:DUF4876 domain-containing protein [Prevotella sp.]|uniref:DUF4876 domain-containing protein n=1 Tax=Prevotella sp. TaxID=59823 RepID=UPI002F93AF4B